MMFWCPTGVLTANGANFAGDPRLASQSPARRGKCRLVSGQYAEPGRHSCRAAIRVVPNTVGGSRRVCSIRISTISMFTVARPTIASFPVACRAFTAPALRTYSMNAWVQPMDAPGYNTTIWDGINGYNVYHEAVEHDAGPARARPGFSSKKIPTPLTTLFLPWIPGTRPRGSIVRQFCMGTPVCWRLPMDIRTPIGGRTVMITEHQHRRIGNTYNWPADHNSGDLAWFISASTAPQ